MSKIVLKVKPGAPEQVAVGYLEADLTGETFATEDRAFADHLINEGYATEFVEEKTPVNYAQLTKAQLLDLADERGIIADSKDTKEQIIALLSGKTTPVADDKGETE